MATFFYLAALAAGKVAAELYGLEFVLGEDQSFTNFSTSVKWENARDVPRYDIFTSLYDPGENYDYTEVKNWAQYYDIANDLNVKPGNEYPKHKGWVHTSWIWYDDGLNDNITSVPNRAYLNKTGAQDYKYQVVQEKNGTWTSTIYNQTAHVSNSQNDTVALGHALFGIELFDPLENKDNPESPWQDNSWDWSDDTGIIFYDVVLYSNGTNDTWCTDKPIKPDAYFSQYKYGTFYNVTNAVAAKMDNSVKCSIERIVLFGPTKSEDAADAPNEAREWVESD